MSERLGWAAAEWIVAEYKRCDVRGWSTSALAPVRCVKEAGHEFDPNDWGHYAYAGGVTWDRNGVSQAEAYAALWPGEVPVTILRSPVALLPERTGSWDQLQRVVECLKEEKRDLQAVAAEAENELAAYEAEYGER